MSSLPLFQSLIDQEYSYYEEILGKPRQHHSFDFSFEPLPFPKDGGSANRQFNFHCLVLEASHLAFPGQSMPAQKLTSLPSVSSFGSNCSIELMENYETSSKSPSPSIKTAQTLQSQSKREIPNIEEEEEESQWFGPQGSPLKKKHSRDNTKTKGHRKQCLTRNMKQNFKRIFLSHIKKCFKNDQKYQSFDIIRRLKDKKCLSTDDIHDLFNQEQFKPFLRDYLSGKQIQEDIKKSRVKQKEEYIIMVSKYRYTFMKNNGVFERIGRVQKQLKKLTLCHQE